MGGSTVEEVLKNAAMTANKQVEWLYPHYPVLVAFGSPHSCDMEQPVMTNQLLNSVKKMALISNFLANVTVHALQQGAAQDVAHLPKSKDGEGFSNNKVRQSLNHSSVTHQTGLTKDYAGHPTPEYFNDRVDRVYVHPWAPKFGKTSRQEVARGFVSDEEIRKWQLLHEPTRDDHGSQLGRERAQRNIRRARFADHLATAEPEQTGSDTLLEDKVTSSTASVASTPTSTVVLEQTEQPLKDGSSGLSASAGSHHMMNDDDQTDIANIDPQLLDTGLNSVRTIDSLVAQLLPEKVSIESAKELDNQEKLECEAFFHEQDTNQDLGIYQIVDTNGHPLPMSACDFIATYAKINIVNNSRFVRAWQQLDDSKVVATNNIAD